MPASVSPSSGRPLASMYAEPRPEPGASMSTPPVVAPRTRCASPTPPNAPSLPTTSGTARPAFCASAWLYAVCTSQPSKTAGRLAECPSTP